MSLTQEALEFLAKQGVSAARQDVIFVPGDRKGRFYLRDCDGGLDANNIQPMLQCEARDIPSILEWLKPGPVAQVWFNREQIEGIRDGYSGFDYCRLNIRQTPQLRKLAGLTGVKHDQASFIRLLRIDLAGVVPVDFISLVRKTIFAHRINSEQTVNQGKASLGKQIETQLQGERELPETVRLNVRLFEEFGIVTTIECALEVDLTEQRFALTPYPMEIESALQRGEEVLRSMISEAAAAAGMADLRVFYGVFDHSLGS